MPGGRNGVVRVMARSCCHGLDVPLSAEQRPPWTLVVESAASTSGGLRTELFVCE